MDLVTKIATTYGLPPKYKRELSKVITLLDKKDFTRNDILTIMDMIGVKDIDLNKPLPEIIHILVEKAIKKGKVITHRKNELSKDEVNLISTFWNSKIGKGFIRKLRQYNIKNGDISYIVSIISSALVEQRRKALKPIKEGLDTMLEGMVAYVSKLGSISPLAETTRDILSIAIFIISIGLIIYGAMKISDEESRTFGVILILLGVAGFFYHGKLSGYFSKQVDKYKTFVKQQLTGADIALIRKHLRAYFRICLVYEGLHSSNSKVRGAFSGFICSKTRNPLLAAVKALMVFLPFLKGDSVLISKLKSGAIPDTFIMSSVLSNLWASLSDASKYDALKTILEDFGIKFEGKIKTEEQLKRVVDIQVKLLSHIIRYLAKLYVKSLNQKEYAIDKLVAQSNAAQLKCKRFKQDLTGDDFDAAVARLTNSMLSELPLLDDVFVNLSALLRSFGISETVKKEFGINAVQGKSLTYFMVNALKEV